MRHPSGRLVTVAVGYGSGDTAVIISFLQAYGIFVVAMPQQTASVAWHLISAFGGVEIRVPGVQAEAAQALLEHAASEGAPVHEVRPRKPWLQRVGALIVFLIFQVPPPEKGSCLSAQSSAGEANDPERP